MSDWYCKDCNKLIHPYNITGGVGAPFTHVVSRPAPNWREGPLDEPIQTVSERHVVVERE